MLLQFHQIQSQKGGFTLSLVLIFLSFSPSKLELSSIFQHSYLKWDFPEYQYLIVSLAPGKLIFITKTIITKENSKIRSYKKTFIKIKRYTINYFTHRWVEWKYCLLQLDWSEKVSMWQTIFELISNRYEVIHGTGEKSKGTSKNILR